VQIMDRAGRLRTEGSPTVHIHSTPEDDMFCQCGALISEDDDNVLCPKCRARVRWQRRAEGRRRHSRREV
ncbi:MAG: hypothetical protein ACRDLR_08410, partial [Gaiellaceae bacterium]